MTYTVQQHHVLQFSSLVEQVIQQEGMKLAPFFTQASVEGKAAAVLDLVGEGTVQYDPVRGADTTFTDVTGSRRWLVPSHHIISNLVSQIDQSKVLIDIQSAYVQGQAMALARSADDECLKAFFAPAMVGETVGAATASLPAGQLISNVIGSSGGATPTGMNLAKLKAARAILIKSGVDMSRGRPKIALTSIEWAELMNELQVLSGDFRKGNKPLDDGDLGTLIGFEVVMVEFTALSKNGGFAYPKSQSLMYPGGVGSLTRNIPVWVDRDMYFGTGIATRTEVAKMFGKNLNTAIISERYAGAARAQEETVVQIACTS